MYTGSVLAILASTALTIGLYFLKREAARLPSLDGGWRLTALWAFVRDPWWLLGLALQVLGYGFYLLALRSAPLSIVHTALNGGIVVFVALSVIGLGERMRGIEWLGVSVITASLIALSVSLSEEPAVSSGEHGILLFSLALLALAMVAIVVDPAPRRAIGLSVASGLILGIASVYAKGLTSTPALAAALRSVYLPLTLAANLVGFVLMQAAFQAGRGVVVMPLFSALSNLVPIVGGITVFGESLPERGAAAVLRPLAFALALLGAALLAGFGERAAGSSARAAAQAEEVRSR
jgi:multidrug transporter EmrE-like cation transporter